MRVLFKTNIDAYQGGKFYESHTQVPIIGHRIEVTKMWKSHFKEKKFPIELEVVAVTWSDDEYGSLVICELHYSAIAIKMAQVSGIKLF